MKIIKTKNYGTPMDVIFDGRFIFVESFHGIVAVANPEYDDDYNIIGYKVERTLAIDEPVIERVIRKEIISKDKLIFVYDTNRVVGSLPYGMKIELFK